MKKLIYNLIETIRYRWWCWWEKPHLVDCRNADYGYLGGFMEPADLILLASFRLLVTYVEENKPFEYHYRPDGPPPTFEQTLKDLNTTDLDWAGHYHSSLLENHAIGVQIKELYQWWTKGRKAEHDAVAALYDEWEDKFKDEMGHLKPSQRIKLMNDPNGPYDSPLFKRWAEANRKLDERDQEMLEQLMKIRQHLWT